ncbi:MAG: DUF2231 domain-containing protein [Oceanicaulis sp.]
MSVFEPNPHPMIVHFVIGLLFTASALYRLALAGPKRWRAQLNTAADVMLALGAGFAALALASGLYACATVAHDEPAHAAMNVHRNWALAAFAAYAGLTVARFFKYHPASGPVFAAAALLCAVPLSVTGWRGGKLVYEHGLGVRSLPQSGASARTAGAKQEVRTLAGTLGMPTRLAVNKFSPQERGFSSFRERRDRPSPPRRTLFPSRHKGRRVDA